MANYWRKRAYQVAATDPRGLSERGYVYLMDEFFTIQATSSVAFALATNGVQVEFQFYDITTDLYGVQARLPEGATATQYNYITPRNLNRAYPDSSSASLSSASAVSGGTKIASELVGAAGKAGGQLSQSKIHTLRDNTVYVMTFYNTGNQATTCHMNLGWSESEPESYRIVDPVDLAG